MDNDEINEEELKTVVESLTKWAYSDSLVEVDEAVLEDKLRCDFGIVGRLPTEEECEVLVCGDDDGEIPEELQDDFPRAHEFLGTYWE